MTLITNAPRLPGDQPFAPLVAIELLNDAREPVVGYVSGTDEAIHGRVAFAANGQHLFSESLSDWAVDLTPNAQIEPAGTVYRVTEQRGRSMAAIHIIEVPENGGPYTVLQTLIDEPGSMGSLLLSHLVDTLDAHDASAVSVATIAGLSATDAQAAFAELAGDITTEATARAAADAAEATARGTADSLEATARAAADTALDAAIDAEVARAQAAESTTAGGLAAEITRATAAEAALTASVSAEVTARTSAVSAEAAARAAADTALDAAIDAEVARAQTAESVLTSDLAGLEVDIANVDADLVAEVAARDAAVDAEAAARLAHAADSTGVHGIADTALLVVTSDPRLAQVADIAADLAAEAAARDAADDLEAAARLAHEADTTGVHGIANTAALVVTTDTRLTDERVPTDNSVDDTKVVAGSLGIDRLSVDPRARGTHSGTQLASTISDLTTAVRANRLDQMAAPAAAVDLAGQRLTNGALPVALTDVITKEYADGLRAGLLLKADPVRVMIDSNVNINAPGAVHDGATLTAGVDSVLLAGQTAGTDNGLYLYNGPAVPLTRRSDANTSAEMRSGTAVWVLDGTYADQRWALVTADPITLGVTAQTWSFDGGLAHVTAGNGLTKSGNLMAVGAGTGIEVTGDAVGIAAGGVGTTQLAPDAVTDAKVGVAALSQTKVSGLPAALAARVLLVGDQTITGETHTDDPSTPFVASVGGVVQFTVNSAGVGVGSVAPVGADDLFHVQKDHDGSSGILVKNMHDGGVGSVSDAFIHLFSFTTGVSLRALGEGLNSYVNLVIDAGNGGFNIIQSQNQNITFYTSNVPRAWLDGAGDMTIDSGTNSPNAARKLEIINTNAGSSASVFVRYSSNSATWVTNVQSTAGGGAVNLIASANTSLNIIQQANAAFSLYTNNTERIHIAADGRIGLGITPAAQVHIARTQNTDTAVRIDNPSTGATARAVLQIQSDAALFNMIAASVAAGQGTFLQVQNNSGFFIQQIANAPVVIYTNNVERIRVLAGGNVGVGTNNPLTPLMVGGPTVATFTGTTRGTVTLNATATVDTYQTIDFTHGAAQPIARVASKYAAGGTWLSLGTSNSFGSGITNEALRIDPGGQVGINTATPAAAMHVTALATTAPAIIAQAMALQTQDVIRVLSSASAALFGVTAAGLPRWAAAANVQTTVGAAGGASALPATPSKYLKVVGDDGVTYCVPAYLAA